tara:strand:- start:121 stop:507 length:387 start_codon:yes stop_codon:yes gene_type:complete
MEILDLLKVGSTVKVNPNSSFDRLSKTTIASINPSKDYIIRDFKITDGKGIGVIVELSNGEKEWFFDNEILVYDNDGKKINFTANDENNGNIFSGLEIMKYKLIKSPKKLLNPLNLLVWLLYSLKDSF